MRRNVCIATIKFFARGRSIWKGLTEVRPLDRPDLSFEPADSTIIETVYWFGTRGYEGVLVDVWETLCRNATNILEIGGNVGFYTVVGAKSTKGQYTVLEPLHELAEILRANLRRNALENVEIVEAAAIGGAEPRIVRLNVPDEGVAAPVGAHLVEGSEILPRSSARISTVRGFPFVDLIAGRDLIKIDAEGVESELLSASWEMLTARLPTLVLEILPEAKDLAHLVEKLARDHGYLIQVVPSYGAGRIITVTPDEFSSLIPSRYNSKDIVLSQTPLALARCSA